MKGEVIYFWRKIEAGCPNVTEEQSPKKILLDKKKKLEVERHFSGIWSEIFITCCQKCNPNVQWSVFRYHFFCRNLLFSIVYVIEAENSPIPGGFFSSFPISRLTRSEKFFELNLFLEKKVLYFFWKFREKTTNYFFCVFVDNSLPLVQTAIFKSKRKLWKRKSFQTKI